MFCGPLIEYLFSTNAGTVAFLRTSYSNEYRSKSQEERLRNIGEPTLSEAEAFIASNCLSPPSPHRCLLLQPLPNIRECGIGLKLYFSSLKYFSIVFLLMAFVSVGQLFQNYNKNDYGNENMSLYAQLGGSLGGVEGFEPDQSRDCSRKMEGQQIYITKETLDGLRSSYNKLMDAKSMEVAFDAGYTLIFLISILIFAVWSHKMIEEQRSEHPTLADFSLKFTQLPEARIPRLVSVLEQQGIRVHDVVPIRHINKLVHQIKYIKQFYKSTFLQLLVDSGKKCTYYDFVAALSKRDKLEGKVKQAEMMEAGHSAIIVFESREDRERAHNCFHKGFLSSFFVKLTVRWKNLCGTDRQTNWLRELNVKSVPTPEDIYWENIRKKRWMIRIAFYLLAVFIIILSICILYSLKRIQNSLHFPTKESCINNCNQQYCPCILRGENCTSYMEESTRLGTVQVLIGIAIILVNSMLPYALGKITVQEKQSSKPRRKLSAMLKIFFALLFNTSFVILVVNADFQHVQMQADDNAYQDFTRTWFAEVGFSIMASMLCSIFAPHCFMCLYYVCKKCSMRPMLSFFDTQLAFNNWAIGADIDLPLKTAMQLVVIFGCFIYSGGMPFMLIICSSALFSIYTCEKYMLRFYEKPNERSTILHTWFLRILPWAIVLHCMFSIDMYGSEIFPQMSPDEYVSVAHVIVVANNTAQYPSMNFNLTDYINATTGSYDDRAKNYSGIVFFVILGLAVILSLCMKKIAGLFGRGNSDMDVSHIVHDDNFYGGRSYQIAKNKHYQEVVKTMYEIGGCPDEEADVEDPTPEVAPKLLEPSWNFFGRNKDNSECRLTEQDATEGGFDKL